MGKQQVTSKPSDPAYSYRTNMAVNQPYPQLQTDSGAVGYDNATGRYTMSDWLAPERQQSLNNAANAFNNQMWKIQNPDSAIQQQQQIVRNYEEPAFEKQSQIDMGKVIAGLGNQYSSTYGQLTAGQQALNEGLARAQMENDIYNSGQKLYDQMVQRGQTLGGMYDQANKDQLMPYQTLGQVFGQTASPYTQMFASRLGALGQNGAVQYNPYTFGQQLALTTVNAGGQAAGAYFGG